MTPDTEITSEDLERLGGYLLGAIATMTQLGHNSPALSAIYMEPGTDPMSRLCWDVLRADSGDLEARDRLVTFAHDSGLTAAAAEAVCR